MAPSVPLRACFRKWSGLDRVESYLIVSGAVLEVLISARRRDWLRVKRALMNTNLRRGLGLGGICRASESSGQVIRLSQVYPRTLGSLRDACEDARAFRFSFQGETRLVTAAAVWLLFKPSLSGGGNLQRRISPTYQHVSHLLLGEPSTSGHMWGSQTHFYTYKHATTQKA